MTEKGPKIKVIKLFTHKSTKRFPNSTRHEQRDNQVYNGLKRKSG